MLVIIKFNSPFLFGRRYLSGSFHFNPTKYLLLTDIERGIDVISVVGFTRVSRFFVSFIAFTPKISFGVGAFLRTDFRSLHALVDVEAHARFRIVGVP